MDKFIKIKRGLELVTSCSSGYETSSQKLLCYLDIIRRGSWGIPKIKPTNLCKPIHDIINYSTSICFFESGKCRKEEEKLQKFEYLENEHKLTQALRFSPDFGGYVQKWLNGKLR